MYSSNWAVKVGAGWWLGHGRVLASGLAVKVCAFVFGWDSKNAPGGALASGAAQPSQ